MKKLYEYLTIICSILGTFMLKDGFVVGIDLVMYCRVEK